MKTRRLICALLVCVTMFMSIVPPATAVQPSNESIIWLDDLKWEWIDMSAVECPETGAQPRTSVSANGAYPANSIGTITQPISFSAQRIITFHCSYSPSSASMDFGVITPSGRFYYVNVKEGSIEQSLGISQSGSYSVAIRNNSSQTVRVVGFVNY